MTDPESLQNPQPDAPCVVMCMKWGGLYGPDYVNVLHRAVRAQLDRPFRFVCLTDDGAGLDAEVEVFDIPDPHLEGAFTRKGGWPKLMVYKPDLHGLQGRCLFIDLDSVIWGGLDAMVDTPGEIVVIREWPRFADYFRKRQVNGATGVFTFQLGSMGYLYDLWMQDPAGHATRFRSEQRFVTAYARDMRFWPHPWVISFKRHLLAAPIVNRVVRPSAPTGDVRIVAFHGDPRPIDVVPDKGQVWGSWSRYGKGAVPFVRDYWIGHGGSEPE